MDISSLTCPICYDDFDQQDHVPKILLVCGHTVCSACLSKLLGSSKALCPFDKKALGKKKQAKDFPVNYALTQLLERKVDAVICSKHKKNLSFVCFTDKKRLCYDCISEVDHKKHKIKALDELQRRPIPQKNELKDLLAHCEGPYENINNMLEEGRTKSLEGLRSNFEEMRNQLRRKELELAFEINHFHDSQRKRLKKDNKIDSSLKENIRGKINTLENLPQEIDPFKAEEDFIATKKFINECKSSLKINEASKQVGLVEKDLGENLSKFLQAVKTQAKPLLEIEYPFSDNLKKLARLLPLNNMGETTVKDNDPNILIVSTSLQIQVDQRDFKIIAKSFDEKEISINLKELKMVSDVSVEIKRDIASRDLEILNYIFKFLKGVSSFKLKLESVQPDLLQIFSECLDTNSSSIEVDLEGYEEQNLSILPLLKKMLRKGSFKSVKLNLSQTKLAWNSQDKNILKEMFELPMIQDLYLTAESTFIPHDYISALVFPASLKSLLLAFTGADISNKALGTMIRTALGNLQWLEFVHVGLTLTSITDEDLNNLVISSKFINRFVFYVSLTAITNKTVEFLSKALNYCANNLESLFLGFGNTKITDESLNFLCTKFPKLKYLKFALAATQVTDKGVQCLLDNFAVHSSNLENIEFMLQSTKFTTVSLRNVSEKLERLEKLISLKLSLDRTLITDEDVIPLIREVLPRIKSLKELEFETDYTAVSEKMKTEIKEFAKILSSKTTS